MTISHQETTLPRSENSIIQIKQLVWVTDPLIIHANCKRCASLPPRLNALFTPRAVHNSDYPSAVNGRIRRLTAYGSGFGVIFEIIRMIIGRIIHAKSGNFYAARVITLSAHDCVCL